MIDFKNIDNYKENNRIEAKKALGGLPTSIWSTYSAFANTQGGIILLGVEEYDDKTLHPINLPNPEKLISDFWNTINNSKVVSVNILTDKDVYIKNVNGKNIIIIHVPRAQRSDKPVYLGDNPLTGSFRRNGDGDYKCTQEEVKTMLRDAVVKTQDMIILENMGLDVFDYDSVKRYRMRMKNCRPAHVWEELENIEFLYKIGALGRTSDGVLHPTAAGLLMFGYEYEIVKEYSNYFLDYQEQFDLNNRWTDRIVSSSGEWSGNVYDFYFRVYNKIIQNIKVPFKLEGGNRIDDTPIHKAIREALANCLINADYYGKQGVVIIQKNESITLTNPGGFRIDIETAKSGGVSDPRNITLIKMFNLIDIGERAGSGIPNIFNVWQKQGWPMPTIKESFEPDRITLSLIFLKQAIKTGDKKQAIKTGDKKQVIKNNSYRGIIISYLKQNHTGKCSDISNVIDMSISRTRAILNDMIKDDIIIAEYGNKNRIYKLK